MVGTMGITNVATECMFALQLFIFTTVTLPWPSKHQVVKRKHVDPRYMLPLSICKYFTKCHPSFGGEAAKVTGAV